MEFRQIRYAIAVSQERSFTKAAERLNISQSAVSEQVKLLEERLGFRLMARTGRDVEMTERGRIFLQEAERVANDVMGLTDVARRLCEVAVDKVNLGIISGLAPIVLPKMFQSGGLPENVQLEVRTAPTRVIVDEIYKGHVDIGVAIEVDRDLIPSGLVSTRLFDVELVLITPPGHPLAATKGPADIRLIADQPLIMSELSVGYGLDIMTMLTDLGVRPHVRAIVDNVETMKVMVQAGMGIALVPAGTADNQAKLGLLETLRITPEHRVTIASYRPRQGHPERREQLHDEIMRSLGK